MKKHRVGIYVFWILLSEGVGALAAWLTREDMEIYKLQINKPPLSPPAIVFPIVWILLYALMGVGAARVALSQRSAEKHNALQSFFLQLAVNFSWTIIFFHLRLFGWSLGVLLALLGLVIWMTYRFSQIDKPAARIQVPYVLWLTFAAYLNAGVWYLNG